MPQAQYYTYVIAVILLLSEVMPLCSYCVERGLIYVAIAAPSGRQLSSYSKCTSSNMWSSYDVYSVSDTKYVFLRLILAMS